MQETDEDIVRLCLLGDYKHYAVLVERYEVPVRALVERLTDDDEDSEQIAHRAFVDAYERLRECPLEDGRVAIWLLGIAAEHVHAHLRERGGDYSLPQALALRWRKNARKARNTGNEAGSSL